MQPFDPSASNYYERLGVSPSASADEIRRAYRRIARQTHPDRNPDDPDAADRFRRIKEAYDVLGDPDRRAAYDRRRQERGRDAAGAAADVVTAAHQESVGCLAYTWRVVAGLIAVGVFVVLEIAGVWDMSEPREVALWVVVAAAVTGLLAFAATQSFEETVSDHAVRFGPSDVRVWLDHQMVARVPWTAVRAVRADWERERVVLDVPSGAGVQAYPAPPVLEVEEGPFESSDGEPPEAESSAGESEEADSGAGLRLHLDLSQTDVNREELRRFLDATAPASGGRRA